MKQPALQLLKHATLATVVLLSGRQICAQLRVGAGKVDITPQSDKLPEPYTSIHDPLFTRAILVKNSGQSALLVNVDVGNLQSAFTDGLTAELTQLYGIPRDNMIVSAVHIHSSVGSVGGPAPGSSTLTANNQLFVKRVHDGILEAVRQAQASLQPAEVGFGEGKLFLNTNRDAIDPATRLWTQKTNTEGPSDKTLAVLEFRRQGSGEPIAVYMNYAMHAVTMFLRGDISGDFPEVAEKYIESVYDNKAVAVWTQGAEGDQNPLYMRPILAIDEERIHHEMDPQKQDDPTEYNSAIMRLFLGGAKRSSLPPDLKLDAEAWQVVQAIGTIAAEEVLRVMAGIDHYNTHPVIQGASLVVTCPGRKRLDGAREGFEGHYEDGPDAQVEVGAIRLGSVALGHVNGEPYNRIGVEVKDGSPFRQTMVVALASGGPNGGYMPSDDAANHYTFQALGTRFKPGCAETGIVKGIDSILYKDLESAPR